MKRKVSILAYAVSSVAMAQTGLTIEEQLKAIPYPAIARSAHQLGDVRATVAQGQVNILAGPTLLRPAAVAAAQIFAASADFTADLVVHFEFADSIVQKIKERKLRGNSLSRVFLRVFRQPTFRIVDRLDACSQSIEAPTHEIHMENRPIEIWFRTAAQCLNP